MQSAKQLLFILQVHLFSQLRQLHMHETSILQLRLRPLFIYHLLVMFSFIFRNVVVMN